MSPRDLAHVISSIGIAVLFIATLVMQFYILARIERLIALLVLMFFGPGGELGRLQSA